MNTINTNNKIKTRTKNEKHTQVGKILHAFVSFGTSTRKRASIGVATIVRSAGLRDILAAARELRVLNDIGTDISSWAGNQRSRARLVWVRSSTSVEDFACVGDRSIIHSLLRAVQLEGIGTDGNARI
jgi:hypothetical protein